VRCGPNNLEPQNREVRFEVLDVGPGTAPFRGLRESGWSSGVGAGQGTLLWG
jgi:hypothetical protein